MTDTMTNQFEVFMFKVTGFLLVTGTFWGLWRIALMH